MGQAFLYNVIFFTYVLALTTFYDAPTASALLYLIPFAVGNFLDPLLLGPLFDTVGRQVMITATYVLSGVLLAITGYLFTRGILSSLTQAICLRHYFLFRLRQGERGLSDRERNTATGT